MVRVPNRGSVRFLNLIIHYVNGEIFGTKKGAPYSGMVRFVRRSDTGSRLYILTDVIDNHNDWVHQPQPRTRGIT